MLGIGTTLSVASLLLIFRLRKTETGFYSRP
jgi:hypothetical protein